MSTIGSVLFPWEGKVFGSSHWRDVQYKKADTTDIKYGVYDASAGVVGEDGVKRAPVYQKMGTYNMVKRSIMCILSAPFYIVGTAAYYLLRIVPVTIWIIGGIAAQWIIGGCKKLMGLGEIPLERKYKWKHIPQEAFYSLKQIVKTGYGLGYFAGLCMSIFSPLNGWKVASSCEKAWSDGADPHRSSPSALLLMLTVPCLIIPAIPYIASILSYLGVGTTTVTMISPVLYAVVAPTLLLICSVAYSILAVDWKSSYHPHGYVPVCRQPIAYVIVPENEEKPTKVTSFHGNVEFDLTELGEERKGHMPAGCPGNNICFYEPVH